MRRIALIFIWIFLVIPKSYSQYYTDALRFSQSTNYGTARFQGIGGVNMALGGDLGSLAGNPAGLGVYNRSEIGISTAMGFSGGEATYFKTITDDQKGYLNFPNLGVVFKGRGGGNGTYKGGSFGIGLTRIQNFQSEISYQGKNYENSMTDYFLDQASEISVDDLDTQQGPGEILDIAGLAYYTFLINHDGGPNKYDYWTFNQGYPSTQEEVINTRGAINQWNFTYGGNFNDKVYIGASVGLPQLRYIVEKDYRETVMENDTLDNFRFGESLKIKGSGINLKLGVIVKPADFMRLGFSIQSPTAYTVNEEYSYFIRAIYKNVDVGGFTLNQEEEETVPGYYKYNLTSPMRASAGIAFFAGKKGFVSADVEYVPYDQIRLRENSLYSTFNNSSFTDDNKTIKSIYKGTVNVNIGGELRLDIYRFRAGYAIKGDPYNDVDNVDRKLVSFSAGAGIRLEKYYFDVALVKSKTNSVYQPYLLKNGNSPEVNIVNKNTSFIISSGLFF